MTKKQRKETTDFVKFIFKKSQYDTFTQTLVNGEGGVENWATAYLIAKLKTDRNTANAIANRIIDKTNQETKTA